MTGTDLAGNAAAAPALTWSEAFTNGVTYTRVATSPPALTNNLNLVFTLYAFVVSCLFSMHCRDVDARLDDVALLMRDQCHAAQPQPQGAGPASPPTLLTTAGLAFESQIQLSSSTAAAATWAQSTGPSIVANVIEDGRYTFTARTASVGASTLAEALATSIVTVRTKPPVLVIVSQPPAVQSDPVVTIKFQTTPLNDAVAYYCRCSEGGGGHCVPPFLLPRSSPGSSC